MNRLFSAKSFLVAAVALGAVGAASAAHARTDVMVNIDLGTPAYVAPAPMYVQPRPVYAPSRPVYVEPAFGYYGHERQNRYVQRTGAWGDQDRDGVPNAYDRDSRFYNPRMAHRRGAWGDADRDGVPNRFDHAPANPYRR
jgi:hypothetical protein